MPRKNPRRQIAQQVEAEKGYGTQIAASQQEAGRRTKQFRKESSSLRGAVALAQRATQNTKLGGFKGPEQRQLVQEVRARTKDLGQSLPGLLAPVQSEYKGDLQAINQDVQGFQADREQAIAAELAKVMQNRAEKHQKVDHAYTEAERLIREEALKDHSKPPMPQSEQDWIAFEDALRKVEGVDTRAARKAIKRLRSPQAVAQRAIPFR